MSNFINIEPTEFKDVRTGNVSVGIRVYDDYGQAYDNTWDEIPGDDLEVLRKTLECLGRTMYLSVLMDYVEEYEATIYIAGQAYEWNEVKDIIMKRPDR
jgi:hypothetical protein